MNNLRYGTILRLFIYHQLFTTPLWGLILKTVCTVHILHFEQNTAYFDSQGIFCFIIFLFLFHCETWISLSHLIAVTLYIWWGRAWCWSEVLVIQQNNKKLGQKGNENGFIWNTLALRIKFAQKLKQVRSEKKEAVLLMPRVPPIPLLLLCPRYEENCTCQSSRHWLQHATNSRQRAWAEVTCTFAGFRRAKKARHDSSGVCGVLGFHLWRH